MSHINDPNSKSITMNAVKQQLLDGRAFTGQDVPIDVILITIEAYEKIKAANTDNPQMIEMDRIYGFPFEICATLDHIVKRVGELRALGKCVIVITDL